MERLMNGETTPTSNKRNRKTTNTTWNKKRKRTETTRTPESSLIHSLPDDLLLVIIARVPILFYPILSLVSKSFRSLLDSPKLYKIRSVLGLRESRLYVCINMYPFKNGPSWFTLCRKPDRILSNNKKERKSSGYALARVPIPHSPIAQGSSLVAVGSDIYNIGVVESFNKASSSNVSILDCTSHTWRQAPSLPVELFSVTATLFDQKIYVAGLYKEDVSDSLKNSLTVLDTKTNVCDPLPIPCSFAQGSRFRFALSTCVGGKVNLVSPGMRVVDYNPVEGSWEEVGDTLCRYMFSDSFCQIDDVLYSCGGSDRVFRWYDTEVKTWRKLNGLVGLRKLPRDAFVRLADYGGKLIVLWNDGYDRWKMLWCAQIALERPNTCEIWGKLEWFDHVLGVPSLVSFEKALSAFI